MRQFICFVIAMCLAGCSQDEMIQKFTTPAEQDTAKHYIALLRARDFEPIEKVIDQSIRTPNLHQTLVEMADLMPAGEPTSVKLVGAYTLHGDNATTINLTFEHRFGSQWFLCNVAMRDKEGSKTIVGFRVVPELQSLEEQHRFTLSGKSPLQYLTLAAAVTAAALTLYALVKCIRTKFPRRKWLWILFIIFGFGQVSVNWTTGQWGLNPLSINLFSAGAFSQLYGAWTISVSVPLGAILFLLRGRRLPDGTRGAENPTVG